MKSKILKVQFKFQKSNVKDEGQTTIQLRKTMAKQLNNKKANLNAKQVSKRRRRRRRKKKEERRKKKKKEEGRNSPKKIKDT